MVYYKKKKKKIKFTCKNLHSLHLLPIILITSIIYTKLLKQGNFQRGKKYTENTQSNFWKTNISQFIFYYIHY